MDESPQESSASQNYGATSNPATILHDNGGCPAFSHFNIESITFNNRQVFDQADLMLHRLAVEAAVSLRARSADSWSLLAIEHTKLNSSSICDPAHQPVERVYLAHEMSLAQTTYGGIARHDTNCIALMSDEHSLCAMSCCRCGRLATGVAAANYHNIE